MTGEARVEATYYNQNLSLWEPLIETLERKGERQEVWDMQMKVSHNYLGSSLWTAGVAT